MQRSTYFDNYLATHFEFKAEEDKKVRALDFDTFDKNFLSAMPEDKNARILEVGFGTGLFLEYLKERGYTNIEGVEYAADMVAYVAKKLPDVAVSKSDDIEQFFASHAGQFDAIVMIDVVEHFEKPKVVGTLKLAREALKPGGVVIARCPNGSNPFNIQMAYDDFTHEFLFTRNSFEQVFMLAGFAKEKIAISGFSEESITMGGKIKNLIRPVMFKLLAIQIKLFRAFTQPDSVYTKNIFAVARRD